jgi:hypothetical protein
MNSGVSGLNHLILCCCGNPNDMQDGRPRLVQTLNMWVQQGMLCQKLVFPPSWNSTVNWSHSEQHAEAFVPVYSLLIACLWAREIRSADWQSSYSEITDPPDYYVIGTMSSWTAQAEYQPLKKTMSGRTARGLKLANTRDNHWTRSWANSIHGHPLELSVWDTHQRYSVSLSIFQGPSLQEASAPNVFLYYSSDNPRTMFSRAFCFQTRAHFSQWTQIYTPMGGRKCTALIVSSRALMVSYV